MIRIELSAEQRAALHSALLQVANGQPIILTADGVELAAMISMGDLDRPSQKSAPVEKPMTLADFLQGYVGVLHSSEYAPGGAQLSKTSGFWTKGRQS